MAKAKQHPRTEVRVGSKSRHSSQTPVGDSLNLRARDFRFNLVGRTQLDDTVNPLAALSVDYVWRGLSNPNAKAIVEKWQAQLPLPLRRVVA